MMFFCFSVKNRSTTNSPIPYIIKCLMQQKDFCRRFWPEFRLQSLFKVLIHSYLYPDVKSLLRHREWKLHWVSYHKPLLHKMYEIFCLLCLYTILNNEKDMSWVLSQFICNFCNISITISINFKLILVKHSILSSTLVIGKQKNSTPKQKSQY